MTASPTAVSAPPYLIAMSRRVAARAAQRRQRKLWDMNGLLQLATVIIVAAAIILYRTVGKAQERVNGTTVALLCLLSVEVLLLLGWEKRRRDPFLLLLMMILVVFYLGRIPTLLLFPQSTVVLDRISPPGVGDINRTLFFVFLSVVAMFLGFLPFRAPATIATSRRRTAFGINPLMLAAVFIITIVWSVYTIIGLGFSRAGFTDYSRLVGYLTFIISPDIPLLAVGAFLMSGAPTVVRRYRYLMILLLIVYFASRLISGSRSGILFIFLALVFASLATYKRVAIPRVYVIAAVLVGLPLAIASFGFASIWRAVFNASLPVTEAMKFELSNYFTVFNVRLTRTLSDVSLRMGFLDIATNMIAHKVEYAAVVNPVYYVKSIIDTGYTPGFDIFGVVRAAQALQTVYGGATQELAKEFYNSDQMTVFAECYVLFGPLGALVVMFLVSICFKFVYSALSFREADTLCIARSLVLYIYVNLWINSFGLDWLVIFIPRLIATTGLLLLFLRLGRKRIEMIGPKRALAR